MSPVRELHRDADGSCDLRLRDRERGAQEGGALGHGGERADPDHRWEIRFSAAFHHTFCLFLIGSFSRHLGAEHTEKEKLETDAMFKLDHGGKDREKLTKALPSLTEIQDYQAGWKDDFQLNSALRRKFRVRI